jgi:hypothetical protein
MQRDVRSTTVYEARRAFIPLGRERKRRSSGPVRASSAASFRLLLELLLAQGVRVEGRLLLDSRRVSTTPQKMICSLAS